MYQLRNGCIPLNRFVFVYSRRRHLNGNRNISTPETFLANQSIPKYHAWLELLFKEIQNVMIPKTVCHWYF